MKKKMSVSTRHESKLKIEVLLGLFVQLNSVYFILLVLVPVRQRR